MRESIRLIKLAIVCAAMLTAGCSTFGQTTATSANQKLSESERAAVCALWLFIGWEDADSDATIIEAKVNNAKREVFCQGIK